MPGVTFVVFADAFLRLPHDSGECGLDHVTTDSLWHDHGQSSQLVLEADRVLFSREVPRVVWSLTGLL